MSTGAQLSERQAFDAMRVFLQAYWERFNSAQVSDVLSDTQDAFLADTTTADPAAWNDWRKAVAQVLMAEE
ncbi:MAG: hypothetical protein WB565_10290 [Acidimicrobiales bacterium]